MHQSRSQFKISGQARRPGHDDLPPALIERLRHYFATYKLIPGKEVKVSIEDIYGKDYAHKVVEASLKDYEEKFGG